MTLETKQGTIAQFVYPNGFLILYFMNTKQMASYFNTCKTQVLTVVPIQTFIMPVQKKVLPYGLLKKITQRAISLYRVISDGKVKKQCVKMKSIYLLFLSSREKKQNGFASIPSRSLNIMLYCLSACICWKTYAFSYTLLDTAAVWNQENKNLSTFLWFSKDY